MNVPSLEFLVFSGVAAVLLAAAKTTLWRCVALFAANVAFFAIFADGFWSLVPFATFLALGYLAMRLVDSYKNRLVFACIIGFLTVSFCWLKRYAFFPAHFLLPEIYVTIGLSYAFFRVIAVVVDSYQEALPERVSLLSYVNYTLNFATFVAGPIQLYPAFRRNEATASAALDWTIAADACARIVLGFFKVTVLSPLLAYVQQRAFAVTPLHLSTVPRVLDGAVLLAVFPLFLYVNFSGYTDVVVGVGRFMRFDLPENFNKPFASKGFLEFWGRWHMSLSAWFKTYVYSTLLMAMMRRSPQKAEQALGVIAYFVTFFLVGVWHGRTFMFAALGLLLGLGISGNKMYQIVMLRLRGRKGYQALCANGAYAALSSALTFLWLAISLLFFWLTWDQLVELIHNLGAQTLVSSSILILIAFALLVLIWEGLASLLAPVQTDLARLAPYLRVACYTTLAAVVISVAVTLNAPAPHIVYRAF